MSSSDFTGITQSITELSITTTVLPEAGECCEEQITPRQAEFLPSPQQDEPLPKREAQGCNSTSDTETEDTANMPSSSSSKHHSSSSSSSSSKKHHSSSSSSKHHTKGDEWNEVTDPEERRRIQNRIAQRKFREKAREQKELQEREARNQELAGATYSVPQSSDLGSDSAADQLSGLPWGGLNIPHMVQRGHESAGSSRRGGSQAAHGGQYYDPHMAYGVDVGGGGYGGYEDFGGGVGDDRYFTAVSSSAASSSPSYFSYDAFSGDGGSQTGSGARR